MTVLTFDISGSQIDGARDYQEDAFLITHLGDSDGDSSGSLVIVADGMGGHAAGNVASNMAVQTFNRHISSNFPNDNISNALYEAVLQANGSITATVAETAALKGMGCTLVACVLERENLKWVSVGDSHLYLLRNSALAKKNADHSYGGFLDRMAEAGTPVEPEQGFSRNMLMSALTGEDIAEIDCPEQALGLESGDRIVISSDGLDTLSHEQILEISAGADAPKTCVEALLKGVEDAGAPRQDNTTVIVIDIVEKIEAAPEPEPPPPVEVESFDPDQTTPAIALEDAAPAATPAALEGEPKKSQIGLIAAVVVVLAVIGGGAFWFTNQGAPDPAADDGPLIVEEDPLPLEDEADSSGEEQEPVVDSAPPTVTMPTVTTPTVAEESGDFRDRLKSGGEGPLMVWVPSGRASMGSRITTSDPDEHPQHDVNLAQFAIGVYEVTMAEYRRYSSATGRKMPNIRAATGADEEYFPVYYVSWNDALAYTKWLSTETGQTYTLPSEAQWEYAARGGSDTAYWWGRKLGRSNAHCFTCDTGLDPRVPTAAGRFNANQFGLYDVSGNVQEWVYDCYHQNYDGAPSDGAVFEGGDCTVRVLRGGGYSSGPAELRSAARDKFRFDKGNDGTGFRVALLP